MLVITEHVITKFHYLYEKIDFNQRRTILGKNILDPATS
jgi:hypothetical protein